MAWSNLHMHTEYSLFDGMGKATDRVAYAKELGQTACGITDHGSMSGIIEHYLACKDAEINPIVGSEVYFQPTFNKDRQKFHLTIVCQNKTGYSNLCRILTAANRDNFFRTGTVTLDLLEKYNEGLIVSSACVAGFLPQMYFKNRTKKADACLERFKEIFGDRFYLELMPQHFDDDVHHDMQEQSNEYLMALGKRTKTRCIITTDSHYIRPEDHDTHQVMFQIGKVFKHADYSQRFMPSEQQAKEWFKQMHGIEGNKYFQNTQDLCDRCNLDLDFDEMIPTFDWGIPSKKKLKLLAKEGLINRHKYKEKYIERIKYELDVIFSLGFEDYFLLCWDIINFAKSKNIAVGPGRGSGCGSLVLYAIGVTNVDPLILNTTFERFLRLDKKKLPKILGIQSELAKRCA